MTEFTKILNNQEKNFIQNLEKAYTEGIYADTPANRKLGRVGMSYKEWTAKQQGGEGKNNGNGGNDDPEEAALKYYNKLIGNDAIAEASSPEISLNKTSGKWEVELNTRPLYRAYEDETGEPVGVGEFEDIAGQIEDFLNKNFKNHYKQNKKEKFSEEEFLKESIKKGEITEIPENKNIKKIKDFPSITHKELFNLIKKDWKEEKDKELNFTSWGRNFNNKYYSSSWDGLKMIANLQKEGDKERKLDSIRIEYEIDGKKDYSIVDEISPKDDGYRYTNDINKLIKSINAKKSLPIKWSDLKWNYVETDNKKLNSKISHGDIFDAFVKCSNGMVVKRYFDKYNTDRRKYVVEDKDGNPIEKISMHSRSSSNNYSLTDKDMVLIEICKNDK